MNEPDYEPDYEPDTRATPERIAASAIVAGSVISVLVFYGWPLAIRASFIFMIPLTMVWFPDILVRVATFDNRWNRQLEAPASRFSIRLIAWSVILGVPAAWIIFSQIRVSH